MNKKLLFVWAFALLLLAGAGCLNNRVNYDSGDPRDADETGMKIGILASSGSNMEGIFDALKQGSIRAKGDIDVESLEIIPTIVECDKQDLIARTIDLVDGDYVRAIIAAPCLEFADDVASTLNDLAVPTIFVNDSTKQIQQTGDYIFSIIGSNNYEGLAYDAVQFVHYITKTGNYDADFIVQAFLKNIHRGELGKISFSQNRLAEL